jgi:outer membrane protein TolC
MCATRCWTLLRRRSRLRWRAPAWILANEALSEAQQRYANGVSDNLAVSQAQQSVAQANDQYVTSLYRHNVAKLSLARALGAGENYKNYLGGK